MGQLLKWFLKSSTLVLLRVNLRAAKKTKNISLTWTSLRPCPKIILTTPTSTLTSEAKSKSFQFAASKRPRNVWHVRSKQMSKKFAKKRPQPRVALKLNQRKNQEFAALRWHLRALPAHKASLKISTALKIQVSGVALGFQKSHELAAGRWHLRALPAQKASLLMSSALKIQVSGVALGFKKSHGCAVWLWLQAASLVLKEFQLRNTVKYSQQRWAARWLFEIRKRRSELYKIQSNLPS